MGEPLVYPTQDGQEVEVNDLQNLGTVAGLSDDRVFAELVRLQPFNGNIYKGIIPFGFRGAQGVPSPGGTVQSSGTNNGSITVNPFRAIIGTRNAANAAPPGANP